MNSIKAYQLQEQNGGLRQLFSKGALWAFRGGSLTEPEPGRRRIRGSMKKRPLAAEKGCRATPTPSGRLAPTTPRIGPVRCEIRLCHGAVEVTEKWSTGLG